MSERVGRGCVLVDAARRRCRASRAESHEPVDLGVGLEVVGQCDRWTEKIGDGLPILGHGEAAQRCGRRQERAGGRRPAAEQTRG